MWRPGTVQPNPRNPAKMAPFRADALPYPCNPWLLRDRNVLAVLALGIDARAAIDHLKVFRREQSED